MWHIGIDIGSTCAKLAVMDDDHKLLHTSVQPTGWSCVDTAEMIREQLAQMGYPVEDAWVTATGYGRISVPYANKTVTEITCHAKGAVYLFDCKDMTVIDIGGQDTKVISISGGMVSDFAMNDKCSAGTGRFLEVMGNTMSLRPGELCELARTGGGTKISSMCTVFAESEVISLVGRGEPRENIAYAVVDSIADKVASQYSRFGSSGRKVVLTGGLCECPFLIESLEKKIHASIVTRPESRFAGAIGAALMK